MRINLDCFFYENMIGLINLENNLIDLSYNYVLHNTLITAAVMGRFLKPYVKLKITLVS